MRRITDLTIKRGSRRVRALTMNVFSSVNTPSSRPRDLLFDGKIGQKGPTYPQGKSGSQYLAALLGTPPASSTSFGNRALNLATR